MTELAVIDGLGRGWDTLGLNEALRYGIRWVRQVGVVTLSRTRGGRVYMGVGCRARVC